MKKYRLFLYSTNLQRTTFFLLFLFLSFAAFSQNGSMQGKGSDTVKEEPLIAEAVAISGSSIGSTTHSSGKNVPYIAPGQNGSIQGKAFDAANKEPLIGAAVVINGSTTGCITDFDGNFTLENLKPGVYSLTISYISYETQTKTNVKVQAGAKTELDVAMDIADYALDEVTVVARANRESENILLLEQKQALLPTQAVGASEMSRKGISDAEGAVAIVSGVSKQEGVKNVFVRGLGDRYNATYLNGFPIPSEDPEYKNIALSFFTSDIIQNIGVNKVFNSSLAGDVGGAVIDVVSKELIGDNSFSVEISGGLNSSAIQNPYLIQSGTDYFGFADRTRPSGSQFAFKNKLDPQLTDPVNHSVTFSGGKKFYIGDKANPLSFYAVASHNKDYSAVMDEIVRNTLVDGTIWQDQIGRKYSNATSQLGLANVQYEFKKNRLLYNFMMLHTNNQYVGEYEGKNSEKHQDDLVEDRYWGFLRRQQTNDNLLLVNQLMSEWKFSQKLAMNAGISYNMVTGSEPDRRENYLTKGAGEYFTFTGSDRQKRFYSTLQENDLNLKLDFLYKLNDKFEGKNSNLRVGYNGRFVSDNFDAIEYVFTAISGHYQADNLRLDDAYNQQNFSAEDFLMRQGFNNKYQVTKLIHSPFAEINYQLASALTANAGVKADYVDMKLDYEIEILPKGSVPLRKFYLLPAVNLKYDIDSRHSLRLGLSKTYTLPQSKEISPFQYVNISFTSQGDRNIQPSENYNADLKWDFYLSPSEYISVTGFYKHILRPIGRIDGASSGGFLTYKNIAEFATVAGAELEIRKDIFQFSNASQGGKNHLSMGLNASYIYSDLLLDAVNTPARHVQLEGASPLIVNFDLSHRYAKKQLNLTNSLVFNYFSDRIHTIGAQGYKNIMENGVPTLDFVSSSKINEYFTLKLKAANLLNSTYQLTRENSDGSRNEILTQYKKGINISLGLVYEL